MRIVWQHAAVDPARRRGVSSVRSLRASGRLAQLEERRPYKAKVGGSSPSAPTTKTTGQRLIASNDPERHAALREEGHSLEKIPWGPDR